MIVPFLFHPLGNNSQVNLTRVKALLTELQFEVSRQEGLTVGTDPNPNIFSGGDHSFPGDPMHPGYQMGDGAQVMDRKYARLDGYSDNNKYVKDKVSTGVYKSVRWPDEKQAWEDA